MKKQGILLPAEHGAWGMITEPILLGLLVAPSLSGAALSAFAFAVFLLRTPGLRLLRARRAPSPDPHGPAVRRFASICLGIALTGLLIGALFADSARWIFPFLLALPLSLWTLREQDQGRTRTLWPELLDALAIGAPAAALPLAAGMELPASFLLWGLLALKSVSAILHVRAQVQRFRGRPSRPEISLMLHAAIPAALLLLGLPSAITVPFLLLALRAFLFTFRPLPTPKHIGWSEVAVSLFFVLALGLGFPFG